MQIISGQNVDLITPFPSAEAARIFGWKHCFRTLPEDDDAPAEREEFIQSLQSVLTLSVSCGIVDKMQLTSQRHEAPLVGIVMFLPTGVRDGVLHFAAGRKAFKMGLVEEALTLAIPTLFELSPHLLRISSLLDEGNVPAKSLLKRIGFKFEGVARDAVLQNGVPRSRVMFGLLRSQVIPVAEPLPEELPTYEPTDVDDAAAAFTTESELTVS